VGLEPAEDPSAAVLKKMQRAVEKLEEEELPVDQMIDEDAERLQELIESKAESGEALGKVDQDEVERGEIVDLIDVLKERLGEKKSA
jgi:non-homologous end joining protein Ku